jgi:hypothetical protein
MVGTAGRWAQLALLPVGAALEAVPKVGRRRVVGAHADPYRVDYL